MFCKRLKGYTLLFKSSRRFVLGAPPSHHAPLPHYGTKILVIVCILDTGTTVLCTLVETYAPLRACGLCGGCVVGVGVEGSSDMVGYRGAGGRGGGAAAAARRG